MQHLMEWMPASPSGKRLARQGKRTRAPPGGIACRTHIGPTCLPVTLGFIASAAVYAWLPVVSVRPGQAVPFGRPLLAFLLPTAALLVSVMLGSLWRRVQFAVEARSDEATYQAITLRIVLFILAIHAAVVSGLLSVAGVIPPIAPGLARGVPMLLGIGLMSVGNLLPRMKPNLIIGIRTAGTLANPGTMDADQPHGWLCLCWPGNRPHCDRRAHDAWRSRGAGRRRGRDSRPSRCWSRTRARGPVSELRLLAEPEGRHRLDIFTAWLPRLGIVLAFLFIGSTKFNDDPHAEWFKIFEQIGLGQWFRHFTGAMQVTGALLLLTRLTRTIGAAMLVCTMVGAMVPRRPRCRLCVPAPTAPVRDHRDVAHRPHLDTQSLRSLKSSIHLLHFANTSAIGVTLILSAAMFSLSAPIT